MANYIILSRFAHDAFADPEDFKKLADKVSAKTKKECPKVSWRASFVTMGRFDVIDIVESDDPEQVMRAATIIRSYGHATTETLPAIPWKEFMAKL
jgi:uncharacterized protein with GYD domain